MCPAACAQQSTTSSIAAIWSTANGALAYGSLGGANWTIIQVGDIPASYPFHVDSRYAEGLSRAVLAPPNLSYKPVTPRPHDHGNISHDPTRDSSRDPFATHTPRDLSARDPGNLQPRDPGKITHDLSRNWSSTMSHDKTRFGRASNPLINMWQIVGTINKTRPLNNQRTCDATRSTRTRLIRARP